MRLAGGLGMRLARGVGVRLARGLGMRLARGVDPPPGTSRSAREMEAPATRSYIRSSLSSVSDRSNPRKLIRAL
jgi:hypothetical protein